MSLPRRLEGWKQIAAHMGRSPSWVKAMATYPDEKWRLPVDWPGKGMRTRPGTKARGVPVARCEALDAWWERWRNRGCRRTSPRWRLLYAGMQRDRLRRMAALVVGGSA